MEKKIFGIDEVAFFHILDAFDCSEGMKHRLSIFVEDYCNEIVGEFENKIRKHFNGDQDLDIALNQIIAQYLEVAFATGFVCAEMFQLGRKKSRKGIDQIKKAMIEKNVFPIIPREMIYPSSKTA